MIFVRNVEYLESGKRQEQILGPGRRDKKVQAGRLQ